MDHVCKLNNEEDELFSFGIIQLNKKLRIIRDYCLAIYIYFLCREMHPLFSEQNLNFFLGHHQYFLFLLICRSREMKAQRERERERERNEGPASPREKQRESDRRTKSTTTTAAPIHPTSAATTTPPLPYLS
jgi:hypothetical protein